MSGQRGHLNADAGHLGRAGSVALAAIDDQYHAGAERFGYAGDEKLVENGFRLHGGG